MYLAGRDDLSPSCWRLKAQCWYAEDLSEHEESFADENARPNRTPAQKRPAPGHKSSRIPNVKARFAASNN